jgi:long-chain acyl-CoA synthetase
MADPLSLLPLALAARGGHVDDFPAEQLVAAGIALLQRSATLVRALSGKRSAVLLPTSPQFLVALAASEGRGAVLINPLASPPEIQHQLRDAGVGAVFTNGALASRLPDDVPRALLDDAPRSATVVVDGASRQIDLGSHFGLSIEGEADVPGSDDEAVIVYTSAMTGVPLGAILSHRNLLANARAAAAATRNDPKDRVLALLPFAHLFGLTVTASAPLLTGGAVITMARFSPGRAMERIAAGGVTEVVGVPSVFRALLSALEKQGRRPSDARGALRLCVCGGSPLSAALQERWFDATGVELRQGYGLTEAGPVCLFNRVDRPNVRGALGTPLPGVDVELGDGGEILVRGDNVFKGYVNGAANGLVVRDGWLHSGDRGAPFRDGTIAFDGVIKPMFTRNGYNIYPRELERVIRELPGVTAARVSPRDAGDRDPDIVLDYAGTPTPAEVREWCATQLGAYKQPTVVLSEAATGRAGT